MYQVERSASVSVASSVDVGLGVDEQLHGVNVSTGGSVAEVLACVLV